MPEACRPLKALLERLLCGPTRVAHRLLKQLLEVHEMGGAGSQGGISGVYQASENSDLALWGGLNTGKTVSAHQPHESRLPQYRDNGGFLRLEATQLSLPVCLGHILSCCPSSRAQGECLGVRESIRRPFKRTPEFPATFCLTSTDGTPADLHSQMLWGFVFLILVLQTGEPGVGLGPLAFHGEPLQPRYLF